MQKIDTIEIKNFKSIRHQKIEGCKRINVFIGYPNVGKSNILEALSLFSIDGSYNDFSSYVRVELFTTLFFNGEISKPLELRINDRYRIAAKVDKEAIIFEEQFEKEGTSFEKKDDGFIHTDNSDDVLTRKTFILSVPHTISGYKLSSIGKENNPPEIKKYEFIRNTSYSGKGFFELSTPFGNNIFNIVSSNILLRKDIVELLNEYNLKFINDKETQTYKILKFIDDDNIFTIPYSMLADTLQRLIFFKAAILSNKDSVLLFEEPESHMFPPYISKFTTDVMYDENDNQFFIATHSPFVINDFMENLEKDDYAIFAVGYNKENGETIIRKISDEEINEIYQYGIDLFFNLENYLKDVF